MKKSLTILTVMAVSLAFAGLAFAGGPAAGPAACAAPCKMIMVPAGMTKPAPAPPVMVPKTGKITAPKCITDKCGNCITIPGSCYALWPGKTWVEEIVKVDVYKDLCAGKSKGACMPCGFCVPVKWDCKWKTSVICGQAEVVTLVPEPTKYPFPVKCVPAPCEPPLCF